MSCSVRVSRLNTAPLRAQDEELRSDLVSGLRARVEAMQRIALKVQNVLDEAACFLERGAALTSWADPTASALFLLVATAGALAIAALGLHTVLAALLCWLVRCPVRPLCVLCCVGGASLGGPGPLGRLVGST